MVCGLDLHYWRQLCVRCRLRFHWQLVYFFIVFYLPVLLFILCHTLLKKTTQKWPVIHLFYSQLLLPIQSYYTTRNEILCICFWRILFIFQTTNGLELAALPSATFLAIYDITSVLWRLWWSCGGLIQIHLNLKYYHNFFFLLYLLYLALLCYIMFSERWIDTIH